MKTQDSTELGELKAEQAYNPTCKTSLTGLCPGLVAPSQKHQLSAQSTSMPKANKLGLEILNHALLKGRDHTTRVKVNRGEEVH